MEHPQNSFAVTREEIRDFYPKLAPHIRRTPVISVDGTEFGLEPGTLALKLELLQHTGSFKARGAITNLLTKTVPRAGVSRGREWSPRPAETMASQSRLPQENLVSRHGSMFPRWLPLQKSIASVGTAGNW